MIAPAIRVSNKEIPTTIQNPYGLFANGIPATFIPSALVTIVGTVSTMVITDKNFIAIFRLFDITEAKASIVPLKISL